MKLEHDFRSDMTVMELLQFLDDKRERVAAKLERNEKYFMERLNAHDMSEEEFETLEALTERYERMFHRYSDLFYGIGAFAEKLTFGEESEG